MLYTSYFDNIDHIRHLHPNMVFVSIAGCAPRNYCGLQYRDLAPKYNWWKEWHEKFSGNLNSIDSIRFYTDCYYKTVLDKLDALTVMSHFMSFEHSCMLCYESPNMFCHRHLVSEWLTKNGFFIEEFSYG